MKRASVAALTALSLLAPREAVAAGDQSAPSASRAAARVVQIRVTGDAAALARVRMTARELLRRLDVEPDVESIDEPETRADGPPPLVVAYIDLRDVSAPSIDIEDGRSRQELTRRRLKDLSTLETSVESVLHVLYLAVESSLQVGAAARPVEPVRKKPAPPPVVPAIRSGSSARSGLDFGPLFRLSSLGGSRIVPAGGVALEPRADLGRAHLGLQLSAAVHAATELSFASGTADVRPLHARIVPTFDWLFSSELSGCVGLGGGFDAFVIEPGVEPDAGRLMTGESALDPVLTGLVGARVPIAGRVFLSALASLDLDLRPTAFVARVGSTNQAVLQLPRLRAGFTLALSFSAAGSRRFGAPVEARL